MNLDEFLEESKVHSHHRAKVHHQLPKNFSKSVACSEVISPYFKEKARNPMKPGRVLFLDGMPVSNAMQELSVTEIRLAREQDRKNGIG